MNNAQKKRFVLTAAKSHPSIKGGSLRRFYGELKKLETDLKRAGSAMQRKEGKPISRMEKQVAFNFSKRIRKMLASPEVRMLEDNPYGPTGRQMLQMQARGVNKMVAKYEMTENLGVGLERIGFGMEKIAELTQNRSTGRY